eukprot:5478694-Prymnesium_polylepis.1
MATFEDTSGKETWRQSTTQCVHPCPSPCNTQTNFQFWANWPQSCLGLEKNHQRMECYYLNRDCIDFIASGDALPTGGPVADCLASTHPTYGFSNWLGTHPAYRGGGDAAVFRSDNGRWEATKSSWYGEVVCENICPPSAPPLAPPPMPPSPPRAPCSPILITLYNPCRCSWSAFNVSAGGETVSLNHLVDGVDIFVNMNFCLFEGFCVDFVVGPDAPVDISWYITEQATEGEWRLTSSPSACRSSVDSQRP